MYDLRPGASRLTLFYLTMSAGGALGGIFTALLAPEVFDWVWEHPILILAAALLLPLPPRLDWTRLAGLDKGMSRIALAVLVVIAIFLNTQLMAISTDKGTEFAQLFLRLMLTCIGLLLLPWRWAFVALLLTMMVAQGGYSTIRETFDHHRTRSYFGIYSVYDNQQERTRLLVHGTTLHGKQSLEPGRLREPTTYYGDTSGVGLALDNAPAMFGPHARIGVVGLGSGTLACRHRPGQAWTFFEIDPAIVRYSRRGTFSFLNACAPDARIVVGDARLKLEATPPYTFDMLVIDAFSSDAIPLHLLTDEAFSVYERALRPGGLLLVHISNNYIELEPVLAAIAAKRGLAASVRLDAPSGGLTVASSWVALSRDRQKLAFLQARSRKLEWRAPKPAQGAAWTDDHASVLPYIRWRNIVGKR
jgi:SAM-dependent methyltransferase